MNNIIDYTLAKDWPLTREQNDMIDFGIKRSCAVLSGQAGVGKTLMVLTLSTHLMLKYNTLFTVVICPPKALAAFERELGEKLKVSYSMISSDKTFFNDRARFLVISNTCIDKATPKIVELSKSHKLIGVVDEAHCLQEVNTKIYKEMILIRKLFPIMYFITATTCKNNIMGMYNMLTLLNPNILGDRSYFRNRYLVINRRRITQTTRSRAKIQRVIEEIVGYKNIEELQSKLDAYVIIRQRQYNLNFSYSRIEPNDFEIKAYIAASGGKLSEKAKDFWSVRLRDITFVVDNVHEDYEKEKLSSKEKLFLKSLLNNLKDNRPTIIYCEYINVLERLEYLIKVYRRELNIDDILIIKGGVSLEKRKQIETQLSVRKPCIITSAGGESINLQKANSIIFYDLPYDIASIIQIIGRITRTDTKFDKQYINIIELFGTTDTYKRLCMEKNMKLIESLFGKMNTLPYTTYDNDQKYMSTLRSVLLWAFKKGRLITDNELKDIFNRFE